jgi:hypothetical protein
MWLSLTNIILPAEEFGRVGISTFCSDKGKACAYLLAIMHRSRRFVRSHVLAVHAYPGDYMVAVDYSKYNVTVANKACDVLYMGTCANLFLFIIINMGVVFFGVCVTALVNGCCQEKAMRAALEQKITPGDMAAIPVKLAGLGISIYIVILYFQVYETVAALNALSCYAGSAQMAAYAAFGDWCLAMFILFAVAVVCMVVGICAALKMALSGGGEMGNRM